jgi:predicted enzyme related to lactoylglutathione lyase
MTARVVHFEIPFDDGERGLAFYRDVFDWEIQSMPEMSYNLVSTGPTGEAGPTEPGYIGGGMMQRQEPVTSPVITIDVEDIDAALASVAAHGGAAVGEKLTVGEMGFAAYFHDSEGNLMGLWQSAG